MKKYLIIIIALVFSVSCVSQNRHIPITTKVTLKPPFRNNGEKQDYKALQIFKKEYDITYYAKFNDEVIKRDSVFQYKYEARDYIQYTEYPIFQYGKSQIIYFDSKTDYQIIFEKGLLYPEIFGLENMEMGYIKELVFLSNSPKVKRFRFVLFTPTPDPEDEFSITQYYYFELTNEKANKKTDWKTFVEGAKLTFVKAGSYFF